MMRKDSDDIFNVLEKMQEHELAMAEFYRTCGEVWSMDKEFWSEMERVERRHAQHLEKINRCLSEKPANFHFGRAIKLAAIQTALSGVRSAIERLKKNELPLYKTLFTARDIEQSIIERKYAAFLETDDVERRSLMNEVVSDTQSHLAQLNKKIKEWTR